MANLKKFEENPQRQLLKEISKSHCVMLGSPNHDHHMQPMAPQVDEDTGIIYFYSDRTSELGQAVLKTSGTVHMCHIDNDYQACIRGTLSSHTDKSTIDRFWSPMVDAWFEGGKDDPKLLMLKLVPQDALIWASDKSFLGVMFEVAKANIQDQKPDLGKSKQVQL